MAVVAPEPQYQSESTLPIDIHAGVAGWLSWLHPLLPARDWVGVIARDASNTGKAWRTYGLPTGSSAPSAAMLVAKKAMVSGRVTSVRLSQQTETVLVGIPLRQASQVADRVLILSGSPLPPRQRESCINLCRWASVWLYSSDRPETTSSELSLALLLTHRTPVAVAIATVNSLKREYACQRVSLAIRHRGSSRLRLLAMSDQSRIDARKVLPTQIVAAMQEMLDSGNSRFFDERTTGQVEPHNSASLRLFEDQGRFPSAVCVHAETMLESSIQGAPTSDATVVVILLERASEQVFDSEEQKRIQAVIEPCCSLIIGRLREQTGPVQRLWEQLSLWLDLNYLCSLTNRRLLSVFGAMLVAGVLLWPVPHRVSARAIIEAQDLQILVAPQAGFIASSHARAGDRVSSGQLLATLDDRDLTLAVSKWHTEATKNEQARDQALATRDRVELARLRADAARIAAEQLLVERQLSRAQLRAPFDGVVLSGDLSQQLGSSVVQGDTLFTVGSSDAYRLILDVDERDVGLVNSGQPARVRLAALPDRIWQATVEAVLPVATSTDDGNVFQVPAQLDDPTDAVRPGMEGVAKLHVGTRSLAWVYTRRLRESVKVWLWHIGLIR